MERSRGRRSDLLALLDAGERAALAERLVRRTYRRGDVVFNEGDRGDRLYLVESGRLSVEVTTAAGQTVILRVVHPGEMVGELALVQPDHRRTGRAVVLEETVALSLRRAHLDELRARYPVFDRLLVVTLAEQLVRTSDLLAELLQPPEPRIWKRLVVLAEAYGDSPIRMSQEELAHATGTVRQTVNRVLRAGARDGVVGLERGAVRILDRERLDRLAAGP